MRFSLSAAKKPGFFIYVFEMLTDAEKNNKIMLLIEQTEQEIQRLHLQRAELYSLLPQERKAPTKGPINPRDLRTKTRKIHG
jgi:hypothetical protein